MRDARGGREPAPAGQRSHRDAAVMHGSLGAILLVVGLATGRGIGATIGIVVAYVFLATAWTWWRLDQRRKREAAQAAAAATTGGRPGRRGRKGKKR